MVTTFAVPTRRGFAAASLGTAALAAGALRPGPAAAQPADLMQLLESASDLTRFAAFVRRAGLEAELTRPGQIGLFVPSNTAIERLPPLQLRELEGSSEALRRTVRHHMTDFTQQITPGGMSQGASSGQSASIRTAEGGTLALSFGTGSLPHVDGVRIAVANMRAANGIAHCIDGVLRP